MRRTLRAVVGGVTGVAGLILLPMFAPQSPDRQFREWSDQPPSRLIIRWGEPSGLRVFADLQSGSGDSFKHLLVPLVIFPRCESDSLLASERVPTRVWGSPRCSLPVFLLGSDSLGRDIFSRTVYGIQFSLLASLAAILLTLLVGTVTGSLAGYFAGWTDRLIMRACDLFLSVPGLFFILGLRVLFPMNLSTWEAMTMMIVTFVVISWASVSRVIRGQVMSIKERDHVLAARSIGASELRILGLHILPLCRSVLMVQATFFMPLFLVAEITLSFLGVGVQEPAVSLGLLIRDAASLQALLSQHWKWAPAVIAFVVVFLMNLWSDRARLLGKARAGWW